MVRRQGSKSRRRHRLSAPALTLIRGRPLGVLRDCIRARITRRERFTIRTPYRSLAEVPAWLGSLFGLSGARHELCIWPSQQFRRGAVARFEGAVLCSLTGPIILMGLLACLPIAFEIPAVTLSIVAAGFLVAHQRRTISAELSVNRAGHLSIDVRPLLYASFPPR